MGDEAKDKLEEVGRAVGEALGGVVEQPHKFLMERIADTLLPLLDGDGGGFVEYDDISRKIEKVNRTHLQRTRTKECINFIPFIILFHVFILTWRGLETGYFAVSTIQETVTTDTFSDLSVIYKEVASTDNWWTWLRMTALPILWDPSQDGNRHRFLHTNRLLGAVRIRQWRVKTGHCTDTLNNQAVCYEYYGGHHIDSDPYGPNGEWEYYDCTWEDSSVFYGREQWYPCSAYMLEIPFNLTLRQVNETFNRLAKNGFIDSHTRAVSLEFFMYNAPNHFGIQAKLGLEAMATGRVMTSSNYRVFRVVIYAQPIDYLLIGCQCVFVLMLLFRIAVFLKGWHRARQITGHTLVYLKEWNILEFSWIIACLAMLVFRVMWYADPIRRDYASNPDKHTDEYPPLERTATTWMWESYCAAITCLLLYLQFFKYVNPNPRLNLLIRTLRRAGWTLTSIVIIASFIFVGFVFMGWLVYGHTLWDFKSFDSSFSALARVMLGNFDVYLDMRRVNRFFSPVYFGLFVLAAFILLLNMVLAVIVDAFQKEMFDDMGSDTLGKQIRKKAIRYLQSKSKTPQQMVGSHVNLTLDEIAMRLNSHKHYFNYLIVLDDLCHLFKLSTKQGLDLLKLLDANESGAIERDDIMEVWNKAMESGEGEEMVEMGDLGTSPKENDLQEPLLARPARNSVSLGSGADDAPTQENERKKERSGGLFGFFKKRKEQDDTGSGGGTPRTRTPRGSRRNGSMKIDLAGYDDTPASPVDHESRVSFMDKPNPKRHMSVKKNVPTVINLAADPDPNDSFGEEEYSNPPPGVSGSSGTTAPPVRTGRKSFFQPHSFQQAQQARMYAGKYGTPPPPPIDVDTIISTLMTHIDTRLDEQAQKTTVMLQEINEKLATITGHSASSIPNSAAAGATLAIPNISTKPKSVSFKAENMAPANKQAPAAAKQKTPASPPTLVAHTSSKNQPPAVRPPDTPAPVIPTLKIPHTQDKAAPTKTKPPQTEDSEDEAPDGEIGIDSEGEDDVSPYDANNGHRSRDARTPNRAVRATPVRLPSPARPNKKVAPPPAKDKPSMLTVPIASTDTPEEKPSGPTGAEEIAKTKRKLSLESQTNSLRVLLKNGVISHEEYQQRIESLQNGN